MSDPQSEGAGEAEPELGEGVAQNGVADARARIRKAPNAFRTISEVADDLHIPQHVLRFWETKFPQVKPLKRGGGRRYYRPDDIALLRRISDLLYIQGYTIKGVQRLLRDHGGRLADDIPPPGAEEFDAGDAGNGVGDLGDGDDGMDGLGGEAGGDGQGPMLPLPGLDEAGRGGGGRGRAAVATVPSRPANAAEAEVERLRRVLSQTLIELETLREMMARG